MGHHEKALIHEVAHQHRGQKEAEQQWNEGARGSGRDGWQGRIHRGGGGDDLGLRRSGLPLDPAEKGETEGAGTSSQQDDVVTADPGHQQRQGEATDNQCHHFP